MALFNLLNRLFHVRLGSSSSPWASRQAALRSALSICFFFFQANLSLIATYGAMDGGILQFLQLTVWGYMALVFYVLFEVCLHGLIDRIRRGPG
jgi:hypothetical protein